MDALRAGNHHRSSSDRLLNNYLDSQKSLTTSLLTLLSHSHSSTSSLLAYVTSSPGVLLSVRRAVRHAAFEGPISPSLHETTANGSAVAADTGTPGWSAYVSSLEDFRKDLKQIHLLEEEMSRVKRDREILVTRLIKTTKSRPTKSDIKDMANSLSVPREREGSIMSSQASIYSQQSDVSATNRDTKRAGKLAEAQAELLGCEEHLRSLETRIESERNKVMYRGLEERFRAMEVIGHMWLAQARRGLEDLEKLPELPMNAYELDSNGSLAPSQSASQVGYDDPASPQKRPPRHTLGMRSPGGPGSIVEEEEGGGSSDDEPNGALVLHENIRRSIMPPAPADSTPARPSPLQQSTTGPQPSAPRSPDPMGVAGRRAMSEVGHRAYNPPQRQPQLRRTVSNGHTPPRRAASETSSVHSVRKKGFFASIARFFKGPRKHPSHRNRGGRESPAPRPGGAWQTRTDDHLKRGSTRARRARSDSSSDEDDMYNLVSVSNNGRPDFGGWNAADVGRVASTSTRGGGVKRSVSTRSKATAVSQSSTIVAPRAITPKAIAPAAAGGVAGATVISRSNTVKSTKSAATAKSGATDGPKTRKNGSIARTKSRNIAARQSNNIMSIVDMAPPAMPDVPKAPNSQVNPRMELATAPGSSIVPASHSMVLPSQVMSGAVPRNHDIDELRPSDSISRSNSTRIAKEQKILSRSNSARTPKAEKVVKAQPERPRSVSPLPPSKLRSPPLKSALRPTSPSPLESSLPPPVITTLFSISAPGPVELSASPEPDHERQPSPSPSRPSMSHRNSSNTTTGDETSVYESAVEEGGLSRPTTAYGDENSSDEDGTELGRYNMVDNPRIARRNEIAAEAEGRDLAPAAPHNPAVDEQPLPSIPVPEAPAPVVDDSTIVRRKSVRMSLPAERPNTPPGHHDGHDEEVVVYDDTVARERNRERAFADAAVRSNSPPRDDSPPATPRHSAVWDTRIGRVRDDTSDEEQEPEEKGYRKARRGLLRNSGVWEVDSQGKKSRKSSASNTGSVKSKGSRKSRA